MNREVIVNQTDNLEVVEKSGPKPEEIAAAVAVGLAIIGLLYVLWRLANSGAAGQVGGEAAKTAVKSSIGIGEIAAMLNS